MVTFDLTQSCREKDEYSECHALHQESPERPDEETYLDRRSFNDTAMGLLPDEILLKIFGYLGCPDLSSIACTCQKLNQVAQDPSLMPLANTLKFGKDAWEEYFGIVDDEPLLSRKIEIFLNKESKAFPLKKIHEAYLLTLIPAKVNGKPFNLNYLEDLAKGAKKGHASCYNKWSYHLVKNEDKIYSPDNGYWVLISRDVVDNSNMKSYKEKKNLVKKIGEGEVPKILEFVTSIFAEHARCGQRLYNRHENEAIYTSLQETSTYGQQLSAGAFSENGLCINGGEEFAEKITNLYISISITFK